MSKRRDPDAVVDRLLKAIRLLEDAGYVVKKGRLKNPKGRSPISGA